MSVVFLEVLLILFSFRLRPLLGLLYQGFVCWISSSLLLDWCSWAMAFLVWVRVFQNVSVYRRVAVHTYSTGAAAYPITVHHLHHLETLTVQAFPADMEWILNILSAPNVRKLELHFMESVSKYSVLLTTPQLRFSLVHTLSLASFCSETSSWTQMIAFFLQSMPQLTSLQMFSVLSPIYLLGFPVSINQDNIGDARICWSTSDGILCPTITNLGVSGIDLRLIERQMVLHLRQTCIFPHHNPYSLPLTLLQTPIARIW